MEMEFYTKKCIKFWIQRPQTVWDINGSSTPWRQREEEDDDDDDEGHGWW